MFFPFNDNLMLSYVDHYILIFLLYSCRGDFCCTARRRRLSIPKIIVTSRYINPNVHKRFGNYIRYIATCEGVAIPENKREIDCVIFMNYLDSRPQSHGLFTGTDEKIVLDKAAKEVANHQGTIYHFVWHILRQIKISKKIFVLLLTGLFPHAVIEKSLCSSFSTDIFLTSDG